MPFKVPEEGPAILWKRYSEQERLPERRYKIAASIGLGAVVLGLIFQIMGAVNVHAQFASVTVTLQTTEALSPALTTIAAVAAVVWTGSLIVLQLRERQPSSLPVHEAYRQQTSTIQAGMACAAFGFLVPLVLLIFTGLLLHLAFIIGALIYLSLTWRNPGMIWRYLRQQPPEVKWAEINIVYALPTLGLVALAVFPHPLLCAFLSLLGVFLAYYYVSGELRSTSDNM
jgi:hypothetical protein